jgi:GTP1/Obg family GTP-binding protein
MNKSLYWYQPSPLAEDILYAISCVQDYRGTVDENTEEWSQITRRIERLYKFYYELIEIQNFFDQGA